MRVILVQGDRHGFKYDCSTNTITLAYANGNLMEACLTYSDLLFHYGVTATFPGLDARVLLEKAEIRY